MSMLFRILLLGIVGSYSCVFGMNAPKKTWVYWNPEKKQYEYRPLVHKKQKECAIPESNSNQVHSTQNELTDVNKLYAVAQQAKNGCDRAKSIVLQAIALPQNQYSIVKHLFLLSMQQYNEQKYGYARVYLHRIGTLLVSIHPDAKGMLRNDMSIIKLYPEYVRNDVERALELFARWSTVAHHDQANYKTGYLQHLYKVLSILW